MGGNSLARPGRGNPSRLRRIVVAVIQGSAIAALYFGLFSILLYPVLESAGPR